MKFNKVYKLVGNKWESYGYVCPSCNNIKLTEYIINKHFPDKCPKYKQYIKQKEQKDTENE